MTIGESVQGRKSVYDVFWGLARIEMASSEMRLGQASFSSRQL